MSRRVRTYWLLRERYRRAANIVMALGGIAGLLLVTATLETQDSPDLRSLAFGGLVVGAMALVPRLLVRGLWLAQRSRLRERLG